MVEESIALATAASEETGVVNSFRFFRSFKEVKKWLRIRIHSLWIRIRIRLRIRIRILLQTRKTKFWIRIRIRLLEKLNFASNKKRPMQKRISNTVSYPKGILLSVTVMSGCFTRWGPCFKSVKKSNKSQHPVKRCQIAPGMRKMESL